VLVWRVLTLIVQVLVIIKIIEDAATCTKIALNQF